MHKRLKLDGHNAHVLRDANGRDTGCLYTVNPEKRRVTAWIPLCVCGIPASYIRLKTINIIPRMLGRHGYLREVINQLRGLVVAGDAVDSLVDSLLGNGSPLTSEVVDYCRDDVSVTEKAFKLISKAEKKMHKYTIPAKDIKALNDTLFEEESNMEHYVLRCKMKVGNDGIALTDEYVQVIQDGNKFTMLFDNAESTNAELGVFVNYLHGCDGDCHHNKSAEFGNHAVTFIVSKSHDSKMARNEFLEILANGIKQYGPYPLFDNVGSIEFYIQELGPDAKPIYKKEWPSLLNGTLHLDAYVIKTAGSDGHVITNNRPYRYSEFDPCRSISVENGKLDAGALWGTTQVELLSRTYASETKLISDFRDLFDNGKIFVNASRLVIMFEPDRE